jgi:hypothetical protein
VSNRLADRTVGAAKQVVAEIIGDGKLREEGKAQADKKPSADEQAAHIEPADGDPLNPFKTLNDLT